MTYKYVIYDDKPEGELFFERFGLWWWCEDGCERPDGPYATRADAEAGHASFLEWLSEEEEYYND